MRRVHTSPSRDVMGVEGPTFSVFLGARCTLPTLRRCARQLGLRFGNLDLTSAHLVPERVLGALLRREGRGLIDIAAHAAPCRPARSRGAAALSMAPPPT